MEVKNVYRLLIVEDEDWVRERLFKTIDWNDLGISYIDEATNGMEALDKILLSPPDIIITDIRMPLMSGIDLIKEIRQREIASKVVIISGYNEFEYAQKALRLGAIDYLLKPIEDEKIIDCINNCIKQIENENFLSDELNKNKQKIEINKMYERRNFIDNWVSGFYKTDDEILGEMCTVEINFDFSFIACVVIKPDVKTISLEQQTWPSRLIQFTLCNVAHEFFSKLGFCIEVSRNELEVICIIATTKNKLMAESQIKSLAIGIKNMIKKYTNQHITVGIGGFEENLIEIPSSLKEAQRAVSMNKYLGGGNIYDKSLEKFKIEHIDYTNYKLDALINSIHMGNVEVAKESLLRLFNDIELYDLNIKPMKLKIIYMDLFNNIINLGMKNMDESINLFEINYKFFEELSRLQTPFEMYQGLEELLVLIIESKKTNSNCSVRKIMQNILDYIHNNYNKPINLNHISNKFYFNSTYFCKLFKDETGFTFTRYLMKYRIEKAKEMLLSTNYKIYEIAEIVGYEDSQYFNKLFKVEQGITPVQYRENIKCL